MCKVLEQVELTRTEAESIADSILANPVKYGF